MTKILVTSLYSHAIILVLILWIIKQDYKKKIFYSLEAGASLYTTHCSNTLC